MPGKQGSKRRRGDSFLAAIGLFELIKASTAIALTLGMARLFHKNVEAHVEHWLNILRIDPDNKYVGAALTKLNLVHTKELKELTAVGVFYSALFLAEGAGLLLRQQWAEWLTVVATAFFVPLEIYAVIHSFSAIKAGLLVLNIVIVIFLIWRIQSTSSGRSPR